MREIAVTDVTKAVKKLCMDANYNLNPDVLRALRQGAAREESPQGAQILESLIENAEIARKKQVPICQDTGMLLLFVQVGQEVHFTGGSLEAALQEGVRQGYAEGYLRKSVVDDPLRRENTKDNTPAVIYYELAEGDQVKLTALPKGFGSENMGGVRMLKPSQSVEGVIDFVVETVEKAGPNPCPPIVVGVGVGGSMDKAALLSKQALARPVDSEHPDPYYADLERLLLQKINDTGIGPQGLGGRITALGVNVETFPTHIAGLPVAVTISCHVTRHSEAIL